jgi:protein-S-isoprenylcysteine O-methyltransferase Ste14
MNQNTFWGTLIVSSIVFIIWCLFYSYLVEDNQTNFVNITGGVGTILSLIGLIITIYSWHQTKKEVKKYQCQSYRGFGTIQEVG